MHFVIFLPIGISKTTYYQNWQKAVLNPLVFMVNVIKCVDAHLGVFTGFLEHTKLQQISTCPGKQNSPVLSQGEYFLLLGVFWVHLYSCLELGNFPKIAVSI